MLALLFPLRVTTGTVHILYDTSIRFVSQDILIVGEKPMKCGGSWVACGPVDDHMSKQSDSHCNSNSAFTPVVTVIHLFLLTLVLLTAAMRL